MKWRCVLVGAALLALLAPRAWALPDFTSRTLEACNPQYTDPDFGRGVRIIFSRADRFIYHWYPTTQPVQDQGVTLYQCGGQGLPVPNYVANVRMTLEHAQDYLDQVYGAVPHQGNIPVHFVVTAPGLPQGVLGAVYHQGAAIQWMMMHPHLMLNWPQHDAVTVALHEYFHVAQVDRWLHVMNNVALTEGTAEWSTDQPVPLTLWGQRRIVTDADQLNEYPVRQAYFNHPEASCLVPRAGGIADSVYRSVFFWKFVAEQRANGAGPAAEGNIIRQVLTAYRDSGQSDLTSQHEALRRAVGAVWGGGDPAASFGECLARFAATTLDPVYHAPAAGGPAHQPAEWFGLRDDATITEHTEPQARWLDGHTAAPLVSGHVTSVPAAAAKTDDERMTRLRDAAQTIGPGTTLQCGALTIAALARPTLAHPAPLWLALVAQEPGWRAAVLKHYHDGHLEHLQPQLASPSAQHALMVIEQFGAPSATDYDELLVAVADAAPGSSSPARLAFAVTPQFVPQGCAAAPSTTVCVTAPSPSPTPLVMTDGDEVSLQVALSDAAHIGAASGRVTDAQTTLRALVVSSQGSVAAPGDHPAGHGPTATWALTNDTQHLYTCTLRVGDDEQPEGVRAVRFTVESLLRLGTFKDVSDEAQDESVSFMYRRPPPFVQRVTVKQGSVVKYDAQWDAASGARALTQRAREWFEDAPPPTPPSQILVVTSSSLIEAPKVSIGSIPILMQPAGDPRTWVGSFQVRALKPEPHSVERAVHIFGRDRSGRRLDTDPTTMPHLKAGAAAADPIGGWTGYESQRRPADPPDTDTWHVITLAPSGSTPPPPPPPPPPPAPHPPTGPKPPPKPTWPPMDTTPRPHVYADLRPLSTFLLIDTSGSMNDNGKLEHAKTAAIATLKGLSRDAEVGIGSFAECGGVHVPLVGFSTEKRAAIGAVQGLHAEGSTPLVQAVKQAYAYLHTAGLGAQKSLVVLTDGEDTCGGDVSQLFSHAHDLDMVNRPGEIAPPPIPAAPPKPAKPSPRPPLFPVEPGSWDGVAIEEDSATHALTLVRTRYTERAVGAHDAEIIVSQERSPVSVARPQSSSSATQQQPDWRLQPVSERQTYRANSQEQYAEALRLKEQWLMWRLSNRQSFHDALQDIEQRVQARPRAQTQP